MFTNSSLDAIYTVTAVGTLLGGLIAISAGVRSEIVTPVVLVGAIIVGAISFYWLLGEGNPYGSA